MPINILLSSGGGSPYSEVASGDVLSTFNSAVLGQLIVSDESFELHPSLLESFKFDFATSTYILKLRKDLKFHSGRPVTIQDLEFSLVRGFFSTNRSFYEVYLNTIDGIDAIAPGQRFTSGSVKGVKILDSHTISVHLKHPNPSFLHSLAQPYFSLVPIEELNADYISWKSNPVGVGPYRVMGKGFDGKSVSLELISPELAAKGAPPQVNLFTLFDPKVRYDVLVNLPPGYATDQLSTYITEMPASVRTIFFSNQNELGRNKDFRIGVQKLINRTMITEGTPDLFPANEMLPRHFWGRSKRPDPYDLAQAKAHFAKIPPALLDREWKIPVFGHGKLSQRQQYFADKLTRQFAEVGFKVKFYANSEKFSSLETAKESPFRFSARVTDYVDPLIMFASFQSKSPYKFDQPSDLEKSEFEALYQAAADASSLDQRYQTVQKLSEFIVKNAVAVAIAEERTIYYFDPSTITGLGAQPAPLSLCIANLQPRKK